MNTIKRKQEPAVSKVFGRALIVLAALSLILLFDNLPKFYSGYLVSAPSAQPEAQSLPDVALVSVPMAQAALPDEVLVKFKTGVSDAAADEVVRGQGATVKEEIPRINVKVLKVNAAARDAVIAALSNNPSVEFAEKNYIGKALYAPNDPYYTQGYLWGLTRMQAPQAWDISKGNPSVIIAILDSGILNSHPDLIGKIVDNVNLSVSPLPDVTGHGTAVAGIAAAATDNAVGIAAIGFNTKLYNIKVIDDDGTALYSSIINGIIYAADHGAKVISMSVGGTGPSIAMEDAVN